MTGLTETEYRTLRTRTLAILGELGAADNATATAIAANLVPTVEAILRQRVAEALDRAANLMGGLLHNSDCETCEDVRECIAIVRSVGEDIP